MIKGQPLNKIIGLAIWTIMAMLLYSGCMNKTQFEEGAMDMSLLEYAGVAEDSALKFVIYDEKNYEVDGDRDEMVSALKAIQLTYIYRPEVASKTSYGIMDIGNGTDTIKRVLLIDESHIAVGKDYFLITGGEELKALVEE